MTVFLQDARGPLEGWGGGGSLELRAFGVVAPGRLVFDGPGAVAENSGAASDREIARPNTSTSMTD